MPTYEDESLVITSFDELKFLASDTCLTENVITLEIILTKCEQALVLCLTDLAMEKNYLECGVMTDGDSLSLSFDDGKTTKYIDNYTQKEMIQLKRYQTYTLLFSTDKVSNLVVKWNKQQRVWEVFLTQQSSSRSIKTESKQIHDYLHMIIYLVLMLIFILFSWKCYRKVYLLVSNPNFFL